MTILSKPLRRELENAVRDARDEAEKAAREAIARLGVADPDAPLRLSDDHKALRRRLRAHGRTLGDCRDPLGGMTTDKLRDAAAYELWHRMLFGRFLAERGLLLHPELGVAISAVELRDLAADEGAADEWALAEQYAAPGLPGVFNPNDPVLELPIAPEYSNRLRAILAGLPRDIFCADDSLGWTYQFWRASEKESVNLAGGKIGAAELPSVTQLFTEPYMVKFLLHNTLGSWWAGKVLTQNPVLAREAVDEAALRNACSIDGINWEYLRFVRDSDDEALWRPAAGTFPGWPNYASEITYCDPCCGSGHFLIEAFCILAALRRHTEDLSPAKAALAVLRDNLHGLEIDGRCVQIATFNVALTAWKFVGEPIALPSPHIAWVGAPPPMSRAEMSLLSNDDATLRRALEGLYDQFSQAPLLGSLLEIGAKDLLDADVRSRGSSALMILRSAEPEMSEGALAARGLLDASSLLARRYVLLATNVPFLGRSKQAASLALFLEHHYEAAKPDLATAMLDRMFGLTVRCGTVAAVSPQNWLFLTSYKAFRSKLLRLFEWNLVARLGPKGFQTPMWDFNTQLGIISKCTTLSTHELAGIDVSLAQNCEMKAELLRGDVESQVLLINQADQLKNADGAIVLTKARRGKLLSEIADPVHGLAPGDTERVVRCFWEVKAVSPPWHLMASRPRGGDWFSGKSEIIFDPVIISDSFQIPGFRFDGRRAWGGRGLVVGKVGELPCAAYYGEVFDDNVHVLRVDNKEHLAAVWSFCKSSNFAAAVREINQKLAVTTSTIAKVSFDFDHWQEVALREYPNGLPEPYSDDPTQWFFHGHPAYSSPGTELHVALARIAGYRWPAEIREDICLSKEGRNKVEMAAALPFAHGDGILPVHANGEFPPLVDRLRELIRVAYGHLECLPLGVEQALVRSADLRFDRSESRDSTLESWLSDRAFRQHSALFKQRPFLWHIWDGMRGGFSAFLNYHNLNRATLDKLSYTTLGDWIRTAKADSKTAQLERAERLQQGLIKIAEGERPYDIFIRWKVLAQQPIGWEPDVDDGVRVNIRPFMTAGILREQPKGISWNKDRGTDVASAPWFDLGPQYGGKQGDRINDHHTTLAEKRASRGFT